MKTINQFNTQLTCTNSNHELNKHHLHNVTIEVLADDDIYEVWCTPQSIYENKTGITTDVVSESFEIEPPRSNQYRLWTKTQIQNIEQIIKAMKVFGCDDDE